MPEFNWDLRDVRFAVFEYCRAGELAGKGPFAGQSVEDYEMVIEQGAKLCKDVLWPLREPADRIGARFEDGKVSTPPGYKEAFHQLAEDGWFSIAHPEEDGGMGMPATVALATGEMFTGAECALMTLSGLAISASRLLAAFAHEEMRKRFIPNILSGKWAATMCLTEPQAGSYLGDIRTTATPTGEPGVYRVEGQKIFITFGQHDVTENIIHLVLARTPNAPPGTKGLSLFLVPAVRVNPDGSLGEPNGVRCARIEEKMGLHGSPTCEMIFGEDGECLGELIGEEHQGLKIMFTMMNEARLAVGQQGVALANLSYYLARDYARERVQGTHVKNFRNPEAPRVPIIEHPNVRHMLMEARALGEGTRALLLKAAMAADMAEVAESEEERKRWHNRLGLYTPVVKAYGSEAGFRASDVAMQVFGGYGYLHEYGIEQVMRDVKIASIYEGTNSIQAIDLLARKVPRNGGADFRALVVEIQGFVKARKEHPAVGKSVDLLGKAVGELVETTMFLGQFAFKQDYAYPLLYCKEYLTMMGDVLLTWCLLEQAVIAAERLEQLREERPEATPEDDPELGFYHDKVLTARFAAHQFLPRAHRFGAMIRSGDESALEVVFAS